jgi:hypothetical protein
MRDQQLGAEPPGLRTEDRTAVKIGTSPPLAGN